MAEKIAEPTLSPSPSPSPHLKTSDSGEDQSTLTTVDGGEVSTKKEGKEDTVRESKRRKNCPTALNQLSKQELLDNTDSSFIFSFDTKPTTTPEVTPKFGSFNMDKRLGVVSGPVSEDDRGCQIPEKNNEEEEEEEEEKEAAAAEEKISGEEERE
ncbi:hypothetical protein Ancab_013938 [Ancistrocladus abbreviatus]